MKAYDTEMRYTSLITLLLLTVLGLRAEVIVNARVDSTAITQGSRVGMHVEIIKDEPGHVVGLPAVYDEGNPQSQLPDGVEVRGIRADSSAVKGSARTTVNYHLVLQAFDPKIAHLPRIGYVTASGDTVYGNDLSLKVNPVELDSLKDINPLAGEASIRGRWTDWVPGFLYYYWWLFILVLIVLAAGITLWLLYRKNGKKLLPARKPTPPYDWAMQQLDRLQEARLTEKGRVKEYYTHLVDILRKYLQGRFGINAMEMTSRQILDTVRANEATRLTGVQLKKLLEIADFVKFAKVNPEPDDNVKAFRVARQFVEDTEPLPEADKAVQPADNAKPRKS